MMKVCPHTLFTAQQKINETMKRRENVHNREIEREKRHKKIYGPLEGGCL